MLTRSLTAALCGLLALPAAGLSADGENTPLDLPDPDRKVGAAETAAGAGGGTIVRTIVGLAVVIGVIYGLTWILRQVKSTREDRVSGAGLKPLATLPLGPNRALHLVRAGAEVVLVGAGEHGVVPVRTYTEAEARELGLIGDDEPPGEDPPVATVSITAPPAGPRKWLDELRARTVIR